MVGVVGGGLVMGGGGAAAPPGVDEELSTLIDSFWPDWQCVPILQM